jgi:mono/diheme cytochrome c family protein
MQPTFVFAQTEGGDSAAAAIGWAIFAVILIGFVALVVANMRKGKAEVGAEIELAANRRPYLSDDELETKKLDRTLGAGLLLLGLIGVALPLYWLGEPGRQEEAISGWKEIFISRGENIYVNGAQCGACHGPEGVGGVAETSLLNDRSEFVQRVAWQAPALDTVLYRYSREEVFDILQYGRPNTPMPAWGALGGGPLTDQQLYNVIDYLESIQLPAAEVRAAVDEELLAVCAPDDEGTCTLEGGEWATAGEAMFNMGYTSKFAAGAFSCGRCHTKGWSWGQAEVSGGGFLGPNLTNGSTIRQFPTVQSQIEFISQGAERGKPYGVGGQAGDGTMPGYGVNPNAEEEGAVLSSDQVMYTQDQIAAIVEYERGL